MPHDIWFVWRALEFILYQILTRLCILKALYPSKKALTRMAPGNSKMLLLQGIAWYHYYCLVQDAKMCNTSIDTFARLVIRLRAIFARRPVSERKSWQTRCLDVHGIMGGKSLKLNMAPIIRKSSKKKKHPRNISRCCVSFRVCIFACFSF